MRKNSQKLGIRLQEKDIDSHEPRDMFTLSSGASSILKFNIFQLKLNLMRHDTTLILESRSKTGLSKTGQFTKSLS